MSEFWDMVEEFDHQVAIYDDNPVILFFDGYEAGTRKTLYSTMMFFQKINLFVQLPKDGLTIASLFLNIFHLIVLTRKPMRTGSINMILIALATQDIFIMLLKLYSTYQELIFPYDPCVPVQMLWNDCVNKIRDMLEMSLRRCTSWMVVLMVLVRTLCTAFDDSKVSILMTTKFGIVASFISTVVCFLFSFPILACFLFEDVWVQGKSFEWVAPEECGYPPGFNVTDQSLHYPDEYTKRDEMIDGITVHVLPSLCYPILTAILVRALQRSKEIKTRVRRKSSHDHTTPIVIGMTVCFMIAEMPQGIVCLIQMMNSRDGFFMMKYVVRSMMMVVSILNSAIQCFICFGLSSAYRKTVRTMFRCYPFGRGRTLPYMSSGTTQSTTQDATLSSRTANTT